MPCLNNSPYKPLGKGYRPTIRLYNDEDDNVTWNIADSIHQEQFVASFTCWLETNWESFNNETYWGVNSVTAAIEDDRDIGIVILFKGNVCNNVIRHLPSACRIKGIPFVSITKSVIMPKKTPVAQINAVGIGRANTVLMELSRPLISKCNIT